MTEPHYADDAVTLYHGDCLDVLAELPDASVDAVVTDPPYGLEFMGKDWDAPWKDTDALATARMSGDVVHDPASVGGFQDGNGGNPFSRSRIRYGREGTDMRDFQQWCELWATECLRVLKPGGHLLAFGGTRTWHRLACAIEDAGFEIRDNIAWLYGSGFPKSLDVSKAIDKARDDSDDIRQVCRWLRTQIDNHPTQSMLTIAESFGFNRRMVEHWAARDTDSQPTLPTLAQWDALRDLLGFDEQLDAEVYRLNMRKGEPGEAWANRPVVGTVTEWENRTNYALTSRDGLLRGAPATDNAKRWAGWGTALKPAFEPVVVGRKPLTGTVAGNVLAHGVGALNIDGCRVAGEPWKAHDATGLGSVKFFTEGENPVIHKEPHTAGRWPSNVVVDECAAAEIDRQSGVSRSTRGEMTRKPTGLTLDGGRDAQAVTAIWGHDDEGGASRFFPTFRYQAKAATDERPTANGIAHPTVKPLDLMRWLVRLVTPPGGIVLEPFAGSGTTAEACIHEHLRCIAIEREADYLPLIVARLTKPMEIGFDFEVGA